MFIALFLGARLNNDLILEVFDLKQYWSVLLKEPIRNIVDLNKIEFIDVREIYNNYVGFEKSVLLELVENFNKFNNYESKTMISEVKSPEGEDLSDRPILSLVGVDKNNLRFGILIYLSDKDAVILGLWPKQFFDAVKSDENVLIGAIVAFLKAPENWKQVLLILPASLEIN